MLTDRQWSDFFKVSRAGLALRRTGWLAAALDLERVVDRSKYGIPAVVTQGLGVNAWSRFLTLSVRPSSESTRTARGMKERMVRLASRLGYARLRAHLRYPDDGIRRRVFRTFAGADRDLRACLDGLGNCADLPPVVNPRPLELLRPSPRRTDRLIRRLLDDSPLGGKGAWQPGGLVFRFDRRLRGAGVTWHAMADLTYGSNESAHLGFWLQTIDLDPERATGALGSPWLAQLKQDLSRFGARTEIAPKYDRRMGLIYLSVRFPARTRRRLIPDASRLTRWLNDCARQRRPGSGGSRR